MVRGREVDINTVFHFEKDAANCQWGIICTRYFDLISSPSRIMRNYKQQQVNKALCPSLLWRNH